MNLGPPELCVLCGLGTKIADHLFLQCPKAQIIRHLVEEISGLKISIPNHISNGNWLNFQDKGNTKKYASLIAASSWLIWKARCEFIYNHRITNLIQMVIHTIF